MESGNLHKGMGYELGFGSGWSSIDVEFAGVVRVDLSGTYLGSALGLCVYSHLRAVVNGIHQRVLVVVLRAEASHRSTILNPGLLRTAVYRHPTVAHAPHERS